jgi:hypothetical protein
MRKVAILLVILLAIAAPATAAEAMAPGAGSSFAVGIWRVGNRGIKPGLCRTPARVPQLRALRGPLMALPEHGSDAPEPVRSPTS